MHFPLEGKSIEKGVNKKENVPGGKYIFKKGNSLKLTTFNQTASEKDLTNYVSRRREYHKYELQFAKPRETSQ